MIDVFPNEDKYCTFIDGKVTEIKELNEKDLLYLISKDLRDLFDNKGSYNNSLRDLDSYNLLYNIKKEFEPSESFVKSMLKLRRRYGSIVDDLLVESNCCRLINEYYFQVKEEKESWGIIAPPTMEEICNYVLNYKYENSKKIMK